jgi:hypothetical protein
MDYDIKIILENMKLFTSIGLSAQMDAVKRKTIF